MALNIDEDRNANSEGGSDYVIYLFIKYYECRVCVCDAVCKIGNKSKNHSKRFFLA